MILLHFHEAECASPRTDLESCVMLCALRVGVDCLDVCVGVWCVVCVVCVACRSRDDTDIYVAEGDAARGLRVALHGAHLFSVELVCSDPEGTC